VAAASFEKADLERLLHAIESDAPATASSLTFGSVYFPFHFPLIHGDTP
jgi:hypothetical protein